MRERIGKVGLVIGEVLGRRQEMVGMLVVGRRRAGSCRRRPNIFVTAQRARIGGGSQWVWVGGADASLCAEVPAVRRFARE